MLLPRFLTALIGVPLFLWAIWWGQIPFFILFFGVTMLALYEYYTLAEESAWPVSKNLGLFCGALLSVSIFLFGTKMTPSSHSKLEIFFTPAVFSSILVILATNALLKKEKENAFIDIAVTFLGLIYIVWSLSHLLMIRDLRPDGKWYTLFLFLVIWALDIGAYGGGRKWGRTKLAESISPHKTWEGVLTGTLCSLGVALLCQSIFLKTLKMSETFTLALVIAGLAQVSDLSESLFKRNVRVKDSGNLLPGHGGILDRFDSFLLVSPIYYYLLVLLAKSS